MTRDLVLIHSTGQSATGWDPVVRALASWRTSVHAVELPNDDPTRHADDYAEAIAEQVGALERPVVLAHSGCGLILPAAAQRLEASVQVWLAAIVPSREASLIEELATHAHEAFNPEWIGVNPIGDPGVAREFLFHDCDEETFAWAMTDTRRSRS